MTSIRTDLSALTRDGLLQVREDRIVDLNGSVVVGDRLIVTDSAGGDDNYLGTVRAIREDGRVLLDVDWENEHAAVLVHHDTPGILVSSISFDPSAITGNHTRSATGLLIGA